MALGLNMTHTTLALHPHTTATVNVSDFVRYRNANGIPLGIISQRDRRTNYVLCSWLDKCLQNLQARFPEEPDIEQLVSFQVELEVCEYTDIILLQ